MNLDSSAFVAEPELIRALRVRAQVVDCDQDRVLFHQGDEPVGLYILHAGEFFVSIESPCGDEVISFCAHSGSLLGLPGVVGNSPYSLSAVARRGSEVSFASRDDFASMMLSEPQLSMMILRMLANEVRTRAHGHHRPLPHPPPSLTRSPTRALFSPSLSPCIL